MFFYMLGIISDIINCPQGGQALGGNKINQNFRREIQIFKKCSAYRKTTMESWVLLKLGVGDPRQTEEQRDC